MIDLENNSMTEAEKDAISSDDLHTGLVVFCTDTNKLYIYNNDAWVSVTLSQIMPDYYISNRTYFLSGSLIYSTEGSGSVDKTNGTEFNREWFLNQSDLNVLDLVNISENVSGSRMEI